MDLSGTFVAQYRGLYRFTFTTSVIYNICTPGDMVRVNLKVDGETVAYLFERHLEDPCGGHHQASINTIQNLQIGQVVTVELETSSDTAGSLEVGLEATHYTVEKVYDY